MKVGIMQPYIFPYIGYWQLINAVDKFIVLDDVNYITRGYINRNSILVNGKAYKFTIPVSKASQNKLICESTLSFSDEDKQKFLKTLYMAYKNAPIFNQVYPILEDIINNPTADLTDFITNSIFEICKYLNIETEIVKSSELQKNNNLRAQDRIIEICKVVGADTYINPCGGIELYSKDCFKQEDISLYFLTPKMSEIIYTQSKHPFVPYLSIIDLLMYNSVEKIQEFLLKFELNI